MKSELPKMETRKRSEIYKLLKEFVPHYTPEWAGSDENDPGVALLEIFSYMTEGIVHRLNQAPQKNFIAFLDMLGIKRLPAQPSRAPLTFMLAKGLEKDILIPGRTQVAGKASDNSELPFETEKNLLAIASQLKKVVAYDPVKDAIYIPPQDFLDTERKLESTGNYQTLTSTLANTRYIQLDSADGLKEKDFLKILGVNGFEYKEIKKINTTVIEVTDDFKSDFPVRSIVEKVTNFRLFEGKDMQEHCVYIAHKDFFNVKSTLTFTIYITHHSGREAGITPLDASWEYWGEVKTDDGGEKGEDWHKFVVLDDTNGISKSGVITLSKTTQGEIKEKEINSEKNRWIRCKLNKNLTHDKSWKLPELDNIQFQVSSGDAPIDPDFAFHNETPLDTGEPFMPFGSEPRLSDTFAISSQEAFSKKGANIEIKVIIEPITATGAFLESPAAVLFNNGEKIKVFAKGILGKLAEVEVDPTGKNEAVWKSHLPGPKIRSNAIPICVTDNKSFISVFVIGEKGALIERFYDGIKWSWIDHGTPSDISIIYDPSAIYSDKSGISVYIVGSDGNPYELHRPFENKKGTWIDHKDIWFKYIQNLKNKQNINTSIASSIFTQSYCDKYSNARVKIFLNSKGGNLIELDCKAGDNTSDELKDYGSPKNKKAGSKPFAIIYPDLDIEKTDTTKSVYNNRSKVFVKCDDGHIYGFNTKYYDDITNDGKQRYTPHVWWYDLGELPGGKTIESFFHGYLRYPELNKDFEGRHIFTRDSENHLSEFLTMNSSALRKVKDHIPPGGLKLEFSPFFILDKNFKEHIFSSTDKKSVIEKANEQNSWKEYENKEAIISVSPILSWEYWKKGWVSLKKEDGTSNFQTNGSIKFILPDDIEETEIAGQKNYWIRVMIVGGDYGKETFEVIDQQAISDKTNIIPPKIKELKIGYVLGKSQYPEKCLTCNNLGFLDQTEVSKITDKFFKPFVQMDEKYLTVYLGFERYFRGGPVRIFFDARELKINDETKPKLEWFYSIDNGWNELKGYTDYTEGLIRTDILELFGPLDFTGLQMFGESLSWIKGSLLKGEYDEIPLIQGIYPNTTWALQAATIKNEIIGSSNGNPDQVFPTLKTPVLENQSIRVLEFLSEEEKQDVTKDLGKEAIEEIKDEKGKVIETWILWTEVPDFFDSDMKSRHYTLDRATGLVQFGDGINGMIPPKGDNNIKAFYQTGGGEQGNIGIGEIKSLKTSVPGVEKVSNPVASDGGANAATIEQMLEIGPSKISHRTRAVTISDFEWLARKASRKVVKARCIPNTGKTMRNEPGKVTVIIVPDEKIAQPLPSLELIRKVQVYLEEHCANTISSDIYVSGPSYMMVNVSADVFVNSIDLVSRVEREVKKKLDDFFHPLTGCLEGKGWDFGRKVSDSDIYTLLENIDGVDHVKNLNITSMIKSDDDLSDDDVPLKSEIFLVANGNHKINTIFEKEGNLYGSA